VKWKVNERCKINSGECIRKRIGLKSPSLSRAKNGGSNNGLSSKMKFGGKVRRLEEK
jgi:hypothetical protein